MTLIKSLLLGSAAGIVAVASAQAADLPTKKAAPAAEYVRICSVGGITGFVLPGSDTCMKISGYVTGQFVFGNLKRQYVYGPSFNAVIGGGNVASTAANIAASSKKFRDGVGESTRGQINFDAVSNTAYGPLQSHLELQGNNGWGMDPLGGFVINNAWVSWAGLTAGKHGSFYDFFAGGEAWKDFISPDHSGTPVNLFAYTASFGGGFSATISFERPEPTNQFGTVCAGGNNGGGVGPCYGARSPDIVASLDAKQSWGKAHLAGVLHKVDDYGFAGGPGFNDYNKWGYGIIGGLQFNLPSMGPGDVIGIQAAYSHAAIQYAGVTSSAWSEGDTGVSTNGNGMLYWFGDAFYNPSTNSWSTPKAWSVAALAEHHFSPQFSVAPEISYGSVKYSNAGVFGAAGPISSKMTSWIGGAVFSWDPVVNLDFSLDLLYQHSHFTQPADFVGPGWVSKSDGFNGRLRVTRSF